MDIFICMNILQVSYERFVGITEDVSYVLIYCRSSYERFVGITEDVPKYEYITGPSMSGLLLSMWIFSYV